MAELELARADNHADVASVLRACGLTVEGLDADNVSLLVLRDGPRPVGCAAVEWYGTSVLLRSVAVRTEHRNTGLGARLVDASLETAVRGAARHAFLLTTDADGYFARFGFFPIRREQVCALAPDVLCSPQFTTICPSTARALYRSVPHGQQART